LYIILDFIPVLKPFVFDPRLENNDPWKINTIYARFLTLPKVPEKINLYLATKASVAAVNALCRKNLRFDLIHAHFLSGGFIAATLKDKLIIPLILTVHGHDVYSTPFKPEWRELAKTIFYHSDHIITPSYFNVKHLSLLGVPKYKISVIPNGYDESLFKPLPKEFARKRLNLPSGKRIVISVASLVPVKGHEDLIDAMRIVSKKYNDVILFIIGSGLLFGELNKKVKEYDLRNKVFIIGRRPHNEIPLWINASDVFVLPSLREGFPTVIPEAMGCGKPIVATNVGGIPEAISSNDLGILVNPKDPYALASAILEALDKRWDPEIISQHAKKYSWSNLAKQIINVYNMVLFNARA
jgi:glycosyltransferase involved in cell wall biosynthesis